MRKILLSAISLIFIFINGYSQDEWTSFDFQTTNTGGNGLVGQYVYCFVKDQQGKFWIGTASGISVWKDSEWHSYTTNEGLLVNEVQNIVMDNDGNIWIGYGSYHAGVSKFDGTYFSHYDKNIGLVHNKVNDIIKDNNGDLWFATMGGLSKYSTSNDTWENFTIENGLPTNDITALAIDSQDNIVIGTYDKGIWKYDGSSFTSFNWTENSTYFIEKIYVDSKDQIWVSAGSVFIYTNQAWYSLSYDHSKVYHVWDIIEDKEGNYFLAHSNGVAMLKDDSWTYYTTTDGLSHSNNFSLFVDYNNYVYSGSERGFAAFNGKTWEITATEGLVNNDVNDIFKDNDGRVWFCTQGGISVLDKYNWSTYTETPNGEVIEWVTKGIQDKQGNYWFTTVHGIYKFDGENWTTYNTNVNEIFGGWGQDIIEGEDGNIWFATWGNLLRYDGTDWKVYNLNDGMLSQYIEGLYIDNYNNIWIGSRGGVSMWDGQEFTHYPITDPNINESIISSFYEDEDGNMIAVTSKGLIILRDNTWELWETAPQLWYMDSYTDKNDIAWFGSTNGLYKFDKKSFYSYFESDGLISNVIKGIYREEDTGIFWFATNNGISKLVPDIEAEVSDNKSSYSIQVNTNGITKPFQFSLDGEVFEKNDGVFNDLEEGYYNIYITNAYDTLVIHHAVGNATDINQVALEQITCYPNPSFGKYFFENIDQGKIDVFDLKGQLVYTKQLDNSNNYIDISHLSKGVYLIRYQHAFDFFNLKVIKK